MATRVLCFVGFLALAFSVALASDSPLQDFCVADMTSPVQLNGFACKASSAVQASDFHFSGLHLAGNTSNQAGSSATPVFVFQVPGLNTLGVSLVRIDIAPWGIIPPHYHPRASEIVTVIQGTVEVGFVTSNPDNRFISKVLFPGDAYVFPINLVHYLRNVGTGNVVTISGLSSENPGVNVISSVLFGSKPDIPTDVLAKAFQVDSKLIGSIQAKF